MEKKTFEEFLQEICPDEYATNNSPEGFERWTDQLDILELMLFAEKYGQSQYLAGKDAVINEMKPFVDKLRPIVDMVK